MSGVQHLDIAQSEDGLRLDRWAKERFPALSFGKLQKLCRTGQIRVDGKRVKANARLERGQTVRVPPLGDVAMSGDKKKSFLSKDDLAFVQSLVLYKDHDMIVLNKPAGLAVQGGSGVKRHLDGLLAGLQFKAPEKPRLVHRLDKDTSGVMLLARSRKSAQHLTEAFRSRKTKKTYWALVKGVPRPEEGEIKQALVKRVTPAGDKIYPAELAEEGAQKARTTYLTKDSAGRDFSWLELEPETGRKHQIRVHCASIGHPIVGDGKYGSMNNDEDGVALSRQLHLHAREISLENMKGRRMTFKAELPKHMEDSWKLLAFDPNDCNTCRI